MNEANIHEVEECIKMFDRDESSKAGDMLYYRQNIKNANQAYLRKSEKQ
ncbi:hypothetical protein ACQKGI_03610 [Peribacillus muralis]